MACSSSDSPGDPARDASARSDASRDGTTIGAGGAPGRALSDGPAPDGSNGTVGDAHLDAVGDAHPAGPPSPPFEAGVADASVRKPCTMDAPPDAPPGSPALAGTLDFSYTLDRGYTTSAGVFRTDGTLVRSLWKKVRKEAGAHAESWDGKDDVGASVAAAEYVVKVLYHNIEYRWDGAIGNTSTEQTGASVHHAFRPIQDMAISDAFAFYVNGYNEGQYDWHKFALKDPQKVIDQWTWVYRAQFDRVESATANIFDRSWLYAATDGEWVYFANSASTDVATHKLNGHAGFVTASHVSDDTLARFDQGQVIVNQDEGQLPYANGVYVGTQPGLSGLAVQPNGSLLAVAVSTDDKVYLLNKRSGKPSGEFHVKAPGRMAMTPEGDVWVVSGSDVVRFTDLASSPRESGRLTGFAHPLAVGVSPKEDLVVVADGGASQQLKGFTGAGSSTFVYGQEGGYLAHGAAVREDKFWFSNGEDDNDQEDTFVSFASDGTFWVGDGGNVRSLHFSAQRTFIEEIMFQPHTYIASVDRNQPARVTNQFLEFEVDYAKPIGQSFRLVNNWAAGIERKYGPGFGSGLSYVVTLANGHTYAAIQNTSTRDKDIVELTGDRLRMTGMALPTTGNGHGQDSVLFSDGSVRTALASQARWQSRELKGFDGSNNPQWGDDKMLATASEGPRDPLPRCCGGGSLRTPITSSGILVSFDQSLNDGWHLGGVKLGASDWLWKTAPAVATDLPIRGLGEYDIGDGVQYGGNVAMAQGRQIVFGYHGEAWGGTQASQFMHYFDDGLFIGQFGTPGRSENGGFLPAGEVAAGFAGNAWSPEVVMVNGELYLWVNDESGHGPQRWHLVGADDIAEMSGKGTLGEAIALQTDFHCGTL